MKKWLSILGILAILAVMVLGIIPATVSADSVDLYWVGGNGSWSQTAHWSTSSGGSGQYRLFRGYNQWLRGHWQHWGHNYSILWAD